MLKYNKDDNLYFLCCLIEYAARKTLNEPKAIINYLDTKGIEWIYMFADILHCENIDAVTQELIADYKIPEGTYHCDRNCEEYEFQLVSVYSIAAVFAKLIEDLGGFNSTLVIDVYNSYIGDCINNYVYGFYTLAPTIIYESYKAGEMLE